MFETILKKASTTPARSLMVDNRYEHDIKSPGLPFLTKSLHTCRGPEAGDSRSIERSRRVQRPRLFRRCESVDRLLNLRLINSFVSAPRLHTDRSAYSTLVRHRAQVLYWCSTLCRACYMRTTNPVVLNASERTRNEQKRLSQVFCNLFVNSYTKVVENIIVVNMALLNSFSVVIWRRCCTSRSRPKQWKLLGIRNCKKESRFNGTKFVINFHLLII